MKILLISNPPERRQKPDFPPIGIAYLGAIANNLGHETMLIDAGLSSLTEIINEVKKFSPQIIGVTCWTIDRGMVWKLCSKLKEVTKAYLVIGGPHATIYPEHIFKKTHTSAVIIGEGEETFKELLSAIEGNIDIKSVRGLVLRNDDGTLHFSGTRSLIENLDLIPRPYYAGFKNFTFSNYKGFPSLPHPTAPIISSRGCVFNCTYCGSVRFWGKRWRYRSAENILDEIEWLIKETGAKSIYFFDDNFTVKKERVIAVCEGIMNRGWNIKWSCCSHVKNVNLDLLNIMKKSGCVSIDFGVESGSDKILRKINKKQTREEIEKTFEQMHEVGIKPRAYLMVGNIGENDSTINETIEMIGKIKPWSSIGATILWLLPGTTEYNNAVKNGHITDDFWLNSDDIPYNLQEYSYKELFHLRKRLMLGIAKKKGGISSFCSYYIKNIYYKYPRLSVLRSLIPDKFR